jgi:hypothetical protein
MTSTAPERIVMFRGGVSCRRDPNSPLGLTLIGNTADRIQEMASVAFAGTAPEGLPEVIEDAAVERLDAHRYRISSPPREWFVHAASVHVHHEIAATFYRVIKPRPAPWRRRVFWRIVLALAASAAGRRLLLALRR